MAYQAVSQSAKRTSPRFLATLPIVIDIFRMNSLTKKGVEKEYLRKIQIPFGTKGRLYVPVTTKLFVSLYQPLY